ncbi:MAG: AfsR/SARP family transcriptional regulator [Trebonia sp.]
MNASDEVRIGVLGPVAAWGADGTGLDLKGPRHRAVLARLAVGRGRVVPLGVLIDDLWEAPPAGAAGAIRTFVGDLRRAIEPGRAPRGPAYAEFADAPWAAGETARLTETRLSLVERQAEARLALGLAADAVPDLSAHLDEHPWREDGWRLLALALYRAGRQAEALDVIRGARTRLAGLGLDPGERLAALQEDILRHAPHLDSLAGDVWAVTAAAYQRTAAAFTRTRLEAAATLAGSLALTGGQGLETAMSQRLAAIEAAERLGDPELTARALLGDRDHARQARAALLPAAGEIAGAGSGMLTAGPVGEYL